MKVIRLFGILILILIVLFIIFHLIADYIRYPGQVNMTEIERNNFFSDIQTADNENPIFGLSDNYYYVPNFSGGVDFFDQNGRYALFSAPGSINERFSKIFEDNNYIIVYYFCDYGSASQFDDIPFFECNSENSLQVDFILYHKMTGKLTQTSFSKDKFIFSAKLAGYDSARRPYRSDFVINNDILYVLENDFSEQPQIIKSKIFKFDINNDKWSEFADKKCPECSIGTMVLRKGYIYWRERYSEPCFFICFGTSKDLVFKKQAE
ncbi:MAG: hypothetical protein Q7K65_03475 [Candidatus Buchananbacteria bacterium]|nr:hypothetical protein [Candidatus Buchananbacteria bacterium]